MMQGVNAGAVRSARHQERRHSRRDCRLLRENSGEWATERFGQRKNPADQCLRGFEGTAIGDLDWLQSQTR